MILWFHSKKKNAFIGGYAWHNDDRFFYIIDPVSDKRTEFSSHEAAKRLGWTKKKISIKRLLSSKK